MDYDNDLFLSVSSHLKDRDSEAKMTHCTEVYPDLFVGTDMQSENKKELIIMGITDVISFDVHYLSSNFYRDSGINYHPVDISDEAEPTRNYIPLFLETADLIDRIIRKGGKAFLFCNAGYRKSPAVAIAYLMSKRRMPLTEASIQIAKIRRILPHDGLIKQLCALNRKLYGV
ncbi:dual specificity protein phosphatase 3-like [Mytilus trossulus]|uniref:dual specificity protein phosphatase 3-like n=1 Tax=Mytilus trossulus TaxID=6551 RepID=UPI003004212F